MSSKHKDIWSGRLKTIKKNCHTKELKDGTHSICQQLNRVVQLLSEKDCEQI